jgi:hypothetical protein
VVRIGRGRGEWVVENMIMINGMMKKKDMADSLTVVVVKGGK